MSRELPETFLCFRKNLPIFGCWRRNTEGVASFHLGNAVSRPGDWLRCKKQMSVRVINSTFNVTFKLFNDKFLLGDDGFYQITDGDDSDQHIFLHHRQVANSLLGHHSHAFVDVLL